MSKTKITPPFTWPLNLPLTGAVPKLPPNFELVSLLWVVDPHHAPPLAIHRRRATLTRGCNSMGSKGKGIRQKHICAASCDSHYSHCGPARLGLARLSSARLGSVWLGLAWLGSGSARFGPAQPTGGITPPPTWPGQSQRQVTIYI